MRIEPSSAVLADLPYLSARSGGGSEVLRLELLSMAVDGLPPNLDALLVASDLQGVAPSMRAGESVLLGVALAEQLPVWSERGILPALPGVGVLLAEDLYSAPQADRRGATGDVRAVWEEMDASGCAFVAGVAGNHDILGHPGALARFSRRYGVLDGEVRDFCGLRIGGVGGVAGEKQKHGRRPRELMESLLRGVLAEQPDILVLHEGPAGPIHKQPGSTYISDLLIETGYRGLVICGHSHWRDPVARLGEATVLNVDGRAVLLAPASG